MEKIKLKKIMNLKFVRNRELETPHSQISYECGNAIPI